MNVLAITSLSASKIELYNILNRTLKNKGFTLVMIVCETYDADVNTLECKHLYMLGSDNLARLMIDKNHQEHCSVSREALSEVIALDTEINIDTSASHDLLRHNAVALYGFIEHIMQQCGPVFILKAAQARSPFVAVRHIARQREIPCFEYQGWAYPRTFQYAERLWSPPLAYSDDHVSEMYIALVRELLRKGQQKRDQSKEETYLHQGKYVLYLTGGFGLGATIRNAEEYASIGCNWGNDIERTNAIERALDLHFPECSLLVRQHPYSYPKLEESHFLRSNTLLVNDKSLVDLVQKAQAVICSQTTLIYHVLNAGKPVCVLGRQELDDRNYVYSCISLDDLSYWISQVQSHTVQVADEDTVVKDVAKYMAQCVLSLDHPQTFDLIESLIDRSGVHSGQ